MKKPTKTNKDKSKSSSKTKKSMPAISKTKHDSSAFTWNTPIKDIKDALQKLEEQENDPLAEPLTKDQIYWWSWWTLNMPEVEKRGLEVVPTCSIENAVLKLPRKVKENK